MYVNYFDRYVKIDGELPTVGILLCDHKNDAVVELTLPEDANIYASEYQLYLPSPEELADQVAQVRREIGAVGGRALRLRRGRSTMGEARDDDTEDDDAHDAVKADGDRGSQPEWRGAARPRGLPRTGQAPTFPGHEGEYG